MILIGASAVGLAAARSMSDDLWRFGTSPIWVARPFTLFLLALTSGFIPLRLRQPRPSINRTMIQPGMAACSAVTVVVAFDVVSWATYEVPRWEQHASTAVLRFWRLHSDHPGPAVATIWFALVVTRWWRAERTWLDRLGRVIGTLWLLSLLVDWRFGRWMLALIGLGS